MRNGFGAGGVLAEMGIVGGDNFAGDGNGNFNRQFTFDFTQPHRAAHALQVLWTDTSVAQAMLELYALGFGADQAKLGKDVAFEQCGAEFQIQSVIMRHHDAVATGWQVSYFVDGFIGDDFTHARRNVLGEFLFA